MGYIGILEKTFFCSKIVYVKSWTHFDTPGLIYKQRNKGIPLSKELFYLMWDHNSVLPSP